MDRKDQFENVDMCKGLGRREERGKVGGRCLAHLFGFVSFRVPLVVGGVTPLSSKYIPSKEAKKAGNYVANEGTYVGIPLLEVLCRTGRQPSFVIEASARSVFSSSRESICAGTFGGL